MLPQHGFDIRFHLCVENTNTFDQRPVQQLPHQELSLFAALAVIVIWLVRPVAALWRESR